MPITAKLASNGMEHDTALVLTCIWVYVLLKFVLAHAEFKQRERHYNAFMDYLRVK
jgi:hypothetical protein